MSPAAAVGNSCSDDPAFGGLVSSAERTAFVEAVIAGKLEPDLTAVAYHFEGWLDKDVMDAIFEVSADPTEAVSALAGMFPAESEPADSGRADAADTVSKASPDPTEALSALAGASLPAAAAAAVDSRQADIAGTVAPASSGPTEAVSSQDDVSPTVEAPAGVLQADAAAKVLEVEDSDPADPIPAPDGGSPSAEASANSCGSDHDRSSDSDSSSESGSDSDSEASYGEGKTQAPKTNPRAAAAAAAAARSLEDAVARGIERHARTLEAIQAQRASFPAAEDQRAPPIPPATSAVAVEEDVAESSSGREGGGGGEGEVGAAAESEKDMPLADDNGSSNAELEKVAAFIASYAGEQEAMLKASRTPSKPPKPPFSVPRGTAVPSTTKVQLAILGTAEKTVELPGFEAFMKVDTVPSVEATSTTNDGANPAVSKPSLQHGKDSLFRFLASNHALHSYYLLAKAHVQDTVRRGGKAKGACTGAAAPNKGAPPAAGDKSVEDPDVAEIMRMLGGAGP